MRSQRTRKPLARLSLTAAKDSQLVNLSDFEGIGKSTITTDRQSLLIHPLKPPQEIVDEAKA